jgi:class 3 adenylate cyclase
MTELPAGTVTFLFTDIEGSTQLVRELGNAYGEALSAHRRALRGAVAERGGPGRAPRGLSEPAGDRHLR